MKGFRQLVGTIAHFQSTFATTCDNFSIESFGAPAENSQNSVPAPTDFHPQERRKSTKQSADE